MRFPVAAVLFIVTSFIFFTWFAVSYLLITSMDDALSPTAPAGSLEVINLLPTAFGVIGIIFFVAGLLLIFVIDSLSDEPEYYFRRY